MYLEANRNGFVEDQFGRGLAGPTRVYVHPNLGQVPATLPRVTKVVFNNLGTIDPDNCCALCWCAGCFQELGVGVDGRARNRMEIQFTLAGHRRGIEYDILRTRRSSLWQRVGGAWSRLESDPMGTDDDRHNDDECLTPRGGRLFVRDTPGWDIALPAPHGTIFRGVSGVAHNVNATDVVSRDSFAEWVIARSKADGISWKAISPGPFTFWHCVIWLTRDSANRWILATLPSRIARGALSSRIINSAPDPAITVRDLADGAREWTHHLIQSGKTLLHRFIKP
jgi:hypothetical protein